MPKKLNKNDSKSGMSKKKPEPINKLNSSKVLLEDLEKLNHSKTDLLKSNFNSTANLKLGSKKLIKFPNESQNKRK